MKVWQAIESMVQDKTLRGALLLNALLMSEATAQQNNGALKLPPVTPIVSPNSQAQRGMLPHEVALMRREAEGGDPKAQYDLAVYNQSLLQVPDIREANAWFEKSANQGYAPAQFEFGKLMLQGRLGTADAKRGIDLITAAAEQSNVKAQEYLAHAHMIGLAGLPIDGERAHKWALSAAELGSSTAQFMLGSLCSEGWKHIPQDKTAAIRWYSKAAQQGDAQALFALGMALQESEPEKAVDAFKKAAGQGCSLSMIAIGDLIGAGKISGVAKDEGITWFKKAADQGTPLGELFLGQALLSSDSQVRAAEGLKHIQAAADKGLRSAYRLMYVYYLNGGPGRAADPSAAMDWLQKGAENGSHVCQFELGMCLYTGKNVARNVEESQGWFRKAIDNSGNPHDLNARFMLAQLQIEKADNSLTAESIKHLTSAADGGMVGAQRLLGSHYLKTGRDSQLGMKYLKMAAQGGSADSALQVGTFYLKDERAKEAIPWLRIAAKGKHPYAYEPLGLALAQLAADGDGDLREAQANFVEAAKLGFATSQFEAARNFREGEGGVTRSSAQALTWGLRAANQGDLRAARLLGELYYTGGGGVPRDGRQSVWWHSVVAWGERKGNLVPGCERRSEALLHSDFALNNKKTQAVGMTSGERAQINTRARDTFKPKAEPAPKVPQEEITLVEARDDILEEDVYLFRRNTIPEDKATAAEALNKMARLGGPDTKYLVGMAFMEGLRVERNVVAGERLLKEAAEASHPQAQYQYSMILAEKTGPEAAVQIAWLEKAAASGVPHAQLALGKRLARSFQPAQGIRWLTEAAEQGNLEAKVELASVIEGLSTTEGKAEEKRIEALLRHAASQSHFGAQLNLAHFLLKDPSRPKRVQEGLTLLMKCAEQGDANARGLLGKIYLNGQHGVTADPQRAFMYFSKAAQVGSPQAHYYLGKLHSDPGLGMQNDAKALKHFQSAAQYGMVQAYHMIGTMTAAGRGTPQSPADAIEAFKKAAMQGFVESQIDLAEIYGGSLGKAFGDRVNGYVWAQIAKTNGDQHADKLVGFFRSAMTDSELVSAHETIKKLWAEGKVRAPRLREN